MYNSRWFLMVVFLLIVHVVLWEYKRPLDATDKGRWSGRSGLVLYTDHGTGLQYLKGGLCGGITPRVDAEGNHMKGED